jgi:hypothetical protein
LEQKLHRINESIQLKTNSLMLDKQSVDARGKLQNARAGLRSGSNTTSIACERNALLTGVQRTRSQMISY